MTNDGPWWTVHDVPHGLTSVGNLRGIEFGCPIFTFHIRCFLSFPSRRCGGPRGSCRRGLSGGGGLRRCTRGACTRLASGAATSRSVFTICAHFRFVTQVEFIVTTEFRLRWVPPRVRMSYQFVAIVCEVLGVRWNVSDRARLSSPIFG